MKIFVPKETAQYENRVAATPASVKKLIALGASVTVGIFYSKVNTISEQIQEISKVQTDQAKLYQETREAVSTLRAQRDADRQVLTDIKSDVNEIRNSQLKYYGR